MSEWSLSLRFAPLPHVRHASDDDGVVLLDVLTGHYSTFNPAGALIWSQLEMGATVGEVVRAVRERFGATGDHVEPDVRRLLATLERRGLITRQDPAEARLTGHPRQAGLAQTLMLGDRERSTLRSRGANRRGYRRTTGWVSCLAMLAYVDVLVTIGGFRRLYRAIQTRRPTARRAPAVGAREVGQTMDRVAEAYFKRAWCLQRAAACVMLLRRYGCPADLVLGVRTFPFEAHAWAELGGEPINDTPDLVQRFLVLDRL